MSLRRRLVLSALSGIVLTGTGVLLLYLGGWTRCGQENAVAYIGGLLSILHAEIISRCHPGFYGWLANKDSVALNVLFYAGLPALDWAILFFALLTVGGWFVKSEKKQ